MIALLRGTLASQGLGEVVLDVGGVGYRVLIPPGAATGRAGEPLTLHTHLAVREDALTLYGFVEQGERDLFETLLGVTGVGPKLALAAIGTLGADRLRRAVVTGDVPALTVIPGVGRKGAQRMILELRERLGALDDEAGPTEVPASVRAEVREALAGLGYGAAEVTRALDAVPAGEDTSAEDFLRAALRKLSR